MKFEFNTGRLYTDAGQTILVEFSDDRIWFNDISRGVAGSFDYSYHNLNERHAKDLVMHAYDNGCYRGETSTRGMARPLDWEGKPTPANRSY